MFSPGFRLFFVKKKGECFEYFFILLLYRKAEIEAHVAAGEFAQLNSSSSFFLFSCFNSYFCGLSSDFNSYTLFVFAFASTSENFEIEVDQLLFVFFLATFQKPVIFFNLLLKGVWGVDKVKLLFNFNSAFFEK